MRLYTRNLPGGGTVVIEEDPAPELPPHRARVIVERRADPRRRAGHVPPIIAEAAGDTREDVFSRLYRIASDNVEIARALRGIGDDA
ncbi:MAG: hypothetical protein M3373_00030 [Gemmatimonadota bacterium]|nr:hypothetical protein [Gemmatimonadota bacterium]